MVGKGQLWVLGLMATTGGQLGGTSRVWHLSCLPLSLPPVPQFPQSPRGCAGGWERWRKRMKHPRAAQGTQVTVPAPTWHPCPLCCQGHGGPPFP